MLGRLKESFLERKLSNRRLCDALYKLQASTAEVRKLQNGLQVVCAWTHRIQVGEEWMTPDDFLRTQLHLNLSHGISPQAFDEMKKEGKISVA